MSTIVTPITGTVTGYPGSPQRIRLGVLTLDEPTVFTRSYEVAAWWSKIQVDAGEYELVTNGYWVLCSLPGTIVAEHTPSLFAGVRFDTEPQGERHRRVGQPSSYVIQSYLYDFARRAVHEGRTFEFGEGRATLVDDLTATCSLYNPDGDGDRMVEIHSISRA